jgi:hypothetical protein
MHFTNMASKSSRFATEPRPTRRMWCKQRCSFTGTMSRGFSTFPLTPDDLISGSDLIHFWHQHQLCVGVVGRFARHHVGTPRR